LAKHQGEQRDYVTGLTVEAVSSGALKDMYADAEPFDVVLDSHNKKIAALYATMPGRKEEAEQVLMESEQQLAAAYLDGLISRDVDQAIEVINSGKMNEFLDKETIKEYDKTAKQLQAAQAEDAKAAETERKKIAKEQLKKEQDATGSEFLFDLPTGKLTLERIAQSNLDATGENSKEHWVKELESYNKKAKKLAEDEKKKVWETRPEVKADLLTKIRTSPSKELEQEILSAMGEGLSNTDASTLLDKLDKALKPDKEPTKTTEHKIGLQILNALKTNDLYSSDEEENVNLWAEDVGRFEDFIDSKPDATIKEIQDFIQRLREPVEINAWDKFFDFFSPGAPAREASEALRAAELEALQAGRRPARESPLQQQIPSVEEYIRLVREHPDNQDLNISDDEITQFYNRKFGIQ
jgi:hypothetical protein